MPHRVGEARRAAPHRRRAGRGVGRGARRRGAEAPQLRLPGVRPRSALPVGASRSSSLRVWKGEAKDVAAGFVADKYVTLPKGKAEKLALTMTATEPLLAPVTKGQPVGTVKVSLEGNPVAEFPLVALADVPAANVLGRAWDTCGCGSGDRGLRRTRQRRALEGRCNDRISQRQVPTHRGRQDLRAGPRLHLRRRRVRAHSGVQPQAVPPAAAPRASAAQPRRHSPRESAHGLRNGRRSSAKSSRASHSTTRASISRSRAAWRSATIRFRRTCPRRSS